MSIATRKDFAPFAEDGIGCFSPLSAEPDFRAGVAVANAQEAHCPRTGAE